MPVNLADAANDNFCAIKNKWDTELIKRSCITLDVIPGLIDILERERQQMQATIDDLHRRLDETEEARKEAAAETRRQTLMLLHQPEQQLTESRLFKKLFGRDG